MFFLIVFTGQNRFSAYGGGDNLSWNRNVSGQPRIFGDNRRNYRSSNPYHSYNQVRLSCLSCAYDL